MELARMFDIGEATRAEALENLSPEDAAALTRILLVMKANLATACEKPVNTIDKKRVING